METAQSFSPIVGLNQISYQSSHDGVRLQHHISDLEQYQYGTK